MAELLKTPAQDPLHLVIFLQNGKLSGIYVVGDTITIGVPGKTVESAVFTLLASYYIFNVDYPRQYAMIFAVLQSLVLEQPYLKPTSKKYAFLVQKLRKAMQQTPDTSDEDEQPLKRKRAIEPQNQVIGNSSSAATEQVIGVCTSSSATNKAVIGNSSSAASEQVIGVSTSSSATNKVVIGNSSSAASEQVIGVSTSATNKAVIGNASSPASELVIGDSITEAMNDVSAEHHSTKSTAVGCNKKSLPKRATRGKNKKFEDN